MTWMALLKEESLIKRLLTMVKKKKETGPLINFFGTDTRSVYLAEMLDYVAA